MSVECAPVAAAAVPGLSVVEEDDDDLAVDVRERVEDVPYGPAAAARAAAAALRDRLGTRDRSASSWP